jgi:hypothetical protein
MQSRIVLLYQHVVEIAKNTKPFPRGELYHDRKEYLKRNELKELRSVMFS